MMKKNIKKSFFKKINRKLLLVFFIMFLLLFLIGGINYLIFKSNLEKETVDLMNDYSITNSNILQDKILLVENDLSFMQKTGCFRNFINNQSFDNKKRLSEVFAEFVRNRDLYYQIRYIDINGDEVIRVDKIEDKVLITDSENLQNKADRYYFEDIMNLKEGEIYLSKFDFNIENGEVELREVNGDYVPVYVVRFGTLVYNDYGELEGMLIYNIYAENLLNFVQNSFGDEDISFLLSNQDGDVVSSSFNFDFQNLYLSLLEENSNYFNSLSDNVSDYVFENESIVTMLKIYLDHRHSSEGFNIDNNIISKDNYWVIVSVSSEKELFGSLTKTLVTNFFAFGFIVIFILIFLNAYFYAFITGPIINLSETMAEVEKRNFKVRSNVKTGDELENLSQVINQTICVLDKVDEEHIQLDRAKTEFLSITSHELRSPMTPMKAQLQMLLEGYLGNLSSKQRDSLKIVLRNTERLDRIIQDFLEISRIEAARLNFKFEKSDLKSASRDLITEMKHFMPKKNIKFIDKLESLPIIEVDSDRVMQVLRNLINNAIKFSPKGGEVSVIAKMENNEIMFGVEDEGVGIRVQNQKRIFEPFFQEDHAMSRSYGGVGLGLAICRGIVESQGGKIWIKSELNVGSGFYFTIPLKPKKEIKPIKLLFSKK